MLLQFLDTSAGRTSNTTEEANAMDVDEDPDVLAQKMRDKIAELEREKARAKAQNEETMFIDMQIEELRDFMEELQQGLKEALGQGTKRDRAAAEEEYSTTSQNTGKFVSKLGKEFKNWIKDNQEY